MVLAFIFFGLFAQPVHAQGGGGPVVRCEPIAVSSPVGVPVTIDLYIENVTDLYAADLEITYDPAIAEVVDQLPNPGIQISPVYSFMNWGIIFFNSAITNTGEIHFASTLFFPSQPVTGTGSLAQITFNGLQNGSFPMNFFRNDLSEIDSTFIPSTTEDCMVTIGEATAIDLRTAETNSQNSPGSSLIIIIVLMLGFATALTLTLSRRQRQPY